MTDAFQANNTGSGAAAGSPAQPVPAAPGGFLDATTIPRSRYGRTPDGALVESTTYWQRVADDHPNASTLPGREGRYVIVASSQMPADATPITEAEARAERTRLYAEHEAAVHEATEANQRQQAADLQTLLGVGIPNELARRMLKIPADS